jgi:predicted Zn-dependent protease
MMPLTDDEIWSLCELGHKLYRHDRHEEATRIFRGLVSLDANLPYPWHALGILARRRGDVPRAVECLQNRLDLEPDASRSRLSLAETLYENGYPRDATEVLRHFRRHPDDESEAACRGRILLRRWESTT